MLSQDKLDRCEGVSRDWEGLLSRPSLRADTKPNAPLCADVTGGSSLFKDTIKVTQRGLSKHKVKTLYKTKLKTRKMEPKNSQGEEGDDGIHM